MIEQPHKKNSLTYFMQMFWMCFGAFLVALSIRVFVFPNNLIDGGIIGIAMILGKLLAEQLFPIFVVLLNLPFIILSYHYIRKTFVLQMLMATIFFVFWLYVLEWVPPYEGDPLEIIVLGGAVLGTGVGLIIRQGGCLDGSEILGIIINRKKGFTVGQVVLVFNFFVYVLYGLIYMDWHIAIRSALLFVVAFKMMDMVISGLEEIKQMTIVSSKPEELSKKITSDMGLGLTMLYGRGGYSKDDRIVLNVIVERLDLSELKSLVLKVDANAFICIQDMHEVVYGKASTKALKKKKLRKTIKS
jgi:uncharacterized membrane-anchored protein YitT (DUF2179 family)